MSLHGLATKSDCLDFRRSYSIGAIRGAYWASVFGGVSYFLFLVVAWFSEDSTATSIGIRASLVLLLIFSAAFFSEVTEVAISYYQEVAAVVSGIVLLGTVYLVSTHGGGNPSSPTGASPSLVFGLFIHYAFLKLSIVPAALIGCTVSLIYALFGAPIWIGGNEEVRTGIYLLLVNSVGIMVCKTSEQRERELFCERSRVVDAELRSMNRAEIAEKATLEKSRLLAAVGHDVRQPLIAAMGYLDILKNSNVVREELGVANYINHAAESVKLIGTTLDHVLALGRLDRGRRNLPISEVDLVSLLERLSATLRLEAKNRNVDLQIEIPNGYLEVSSNLGALWQILLNLTSNAIKYSAASEMSGRRVLVHCRIRGGLCQIRIADNGIGVSRLHKEMIWQPYYQVAMKGGREKDGLGLGLFLVRNAADLLENHHLTLRSRLGKGSVFSLTLPGCSRSISSWVDEDSGKLFGRVALEDVFGSYVLVYQENQIDLRNMLELFAEWGVVSEVRGISLALKSSRKMKIAMLTLFCSVIVAIYYLI
jgi:signal transduction histidine kinase